MSYVLAAILFLAPIPQATAQRYAALIVRNAERRQVDPLLVVAIIHVESSWNARARSVTGDHGLGQVHVSATTNPELRGREAVLYDPAVNIRYAVKTLAMWRRWHRRNCGMRNPHPAWAHYQAGYRVRNLEWARKVRNVYYRLRNRFRSAAPGEV